MFRYAFGVMLGEAVCGRVLSHSSVGAAQGLGKHRDLLVRLLHADPKQRPVAAAALMEPLFRGLPRLRECCICMDEVPLETGLECGDAQPHFTCRSCLTTHVTVLAEEDLRKVGKW